MDFQRSHPLETLRKKVDNLLEDFGRGYWQPLRQSLYATGPLVRSELAWDTRRPPIDVVETEKDYEITAELPGVDESCIEVKVANGNLRGKKAYKNDPSRGRLIRRFNVSI
jgi:HSP20 family protein